MLVLYRLKQVIFYKDLQQLYLIWMAVMITRSLVLIYWFATTYLTEKTISLFENMTHRFLDLLIKSVRSLCKQLVHLE